MADKREARKRKIAMSAEERLAKITGLYTSSEGEKPKIQFASENSDPRVEEIELKHEKVEYTKVEQEEKSIEKEECIMEDIATPPSQFSVSNEFSTRLIATFLLALYAVINYKDTETSKDTMEFVGNIFTAFQVLGSIQEFYSSQKYIYNNYLKMIGLGNDRIDLLLRIYDGICNDIYMFVFTFGMGLYLRNIIY